MKGKCICEEVTFDVELENHKISACHCSICRKQTSGIIMTMNIKPGTLKFIMSESLSIYKSSSWGERGFCKTCGTNLFWRTQDHSYCNINVFSLELEKIENNIEFTQELFIDKKPNFYSFCNETKKLTEAEIIELWNS